MIQLPSTQANIQPVYEASNISYNRGSVQTQDGFLEMRTTLQIQYARVDYLMDSEGRRLGTVARAIQGQTFNGFIVLPQDEFPEIADGPISMERIDQLIREDLIKRKILEA